MSNNANSLLGRNTTNAALTRAIVPRWQAMEKVIRAKLQVPEDLPRLKFAVISIRFAARVIYRATCSPVREIQRRRDKGRDTEIS